VQEKELHIGRFSPKSKSKQGAGSQNIESLFCDSNKYHVNQKRLLRKTIKEKLLWLNLFQNKFKIFFRSCTYDLNSGLIIYRDFILVALFHRNNG